MDQCRLSLIIPVIILLSQPLHADTVDKIKFLKVSEQEGKAVIKGSDGKLRTVGVGDVIEAEGTVAGKEKKGRNCGDHWGQVRVTGARLWN